MSADTITIPRALYDEIVDELGGLGMCTPGARLTANVVADCADLAARLADILLDAGTPACGHIHPDVSHGPMFCQLPAGHAGWHTADDHGARWAPAGAVAA